MAGGLAFGDGLAVLGMLFMGTIKTLLNKLCVRNGFVPGFGSTLRDVPFSMQPASWRLS